MSAQHVDDVLEAIDLQETKKLTAEQLDEFGA